MVCTLAVAQLLLVLLSWLLSAAMTEGVRSMLSGVGVRWFFGSFVDVLASPWLVWLLLLAMAGGSLWESRLLHVAVRRPAKSNAAPNYRQRVALLTVVAFLLLYVAAIVALTAIPHAVLLSATGRLFPSAFSRALVPVVAFGVAVAGMVFGLMSGRFQTVADAVASLSNGVSRCAPLFLLYILAAQILASLHFVFG
jgi:aminobenzoyl-glutamate transport protein